MAFVGNGIITSNLQGFLLCRDMAILQLLRTWKAKCAGVIRFPSSLSVLEKTDSKSPDRAFLTQDYREDLVMWRACGTGLQGRNVLCSSTSLSSVVLAYRAVLWPCLSLLTSRAALQVCWPNPDWIFLLVQGLSQVESSSNNFVVVDPSFFLVPYWKLFQKSCLTKFLNACFDD